MSQRAVLRRQWGGPFRGLVTTALRHEVPIDAITGDSRNVLVKPGRVPDLAKLVRRQGTESLGAATGVLEMPVADATMVGREMFEHKSASVTDGYPLLGILFGDESKRYGQFWLRDTNGPTDYTLGEDYSTTHYPIAASTVGNWKVVPLPYDGNGATGMTRLTYEEVRRRYCGGARGSREVGNWRYSPGGLYGTPSKWNRLYNQASGSGSQKMRVFPAGHSPPLWCPSVPTASYPTLRATSAPWQEGDKFFLSCMYEWEDGSFSMPFIPRDINGTLTGGLGLVTVLDTGASPEFYDYLPYRNIPIGPAGVKNVWLLRSPKVSKALIATGSWPAIGDLRIIGKVANGVTSYDDPAGNDASLLQDTARVRFDHKWPDRGRYEWTFDQRVGLGYLKPNACAIILAPTGSAASRDLNGDDSANPGSVFFHARVYSSGATLELHLRKTTGGATTTTAITLSASVSLQSVVDSVNATVFGGSGGEWAAQLVPGVNGSLPSTYLALQSVDLVCATTLGSPTITSAALFADVAEGMKVTGTGIPAGAYVKSKASNSSLTISANAVAPAPGAPTLTFAVDTGDGGIVVSTDTGNMRGYNGAYFLVLPFKQSWLDGFDTGVRDFIISGGGPSHAANAANNFYDAPGNRRSAPAEAGVFMGAAPLREGCIVYYSKRIYWYRNQRAGGSGEDADYRLVELEQSRGCTSPSSVVQGNGWSGCWTDDGFWCFDGERSAILSGDNLDRDADGGFVGELAYEAAQCQAAAAADTTGYGMHAHFRDGRLWLNYRTGASAYAYINYDCTPSVESSGLAQVLTADGQPYGWSSRLTYNWRGTGDVGAGVIGSVKGSGGLRLYGCDDRNDKTNCGLVQRIEVEGSYLDSIAGVQSLAYLVTDLCGTLSKKSLVRLTAVYEYSTADAGVSDVLNLTFYKRQDRTSSFTRTLPRTAATGVFSRKVLEVPMSGRGAAECFEARFSFGSNPDTGAVAIAMLAAEYEVLDSLN